MNNQLRAINAQLNLLASTLKSNVHSLLNTESYMVVQDFMWSLSARLDDILDDMEHLDDEAEYQAVSERVDKAHMAFAKVHTNWRKLHGHKMQALINILTEDPAIEDSRCPHCKEIVIESNGNSCPHCTEVII